MGFLSDSGLADGGCGRDGVKEAIDWLYSRVQTARKMLVV